MSARSPYFGLVGEVFHGVNVLFLVSFAAHDRQFTKQMMTHVGKTATAPI